MPAHKTIKLEGGPEADAISRRSFLFKTAKAGAAAAGLGALSFFEGCARRSPEEVLRGESIDVTEVVRQVKPGERLDFESAVAAQLKASPKKAALLARARARGWTDEMLRDTFLEIQAGDEDARKATSALMGREFGFKSVLLTFREDENFLRMFPITSTLCLDTLGVTKLTPAEIKSVIRSGMQHEAAHKAIYDSSQEVMKTGDNSRLNYFTFERIWTAGGLKKMNQVHTQHVFEQGLPEVLCDKLGLRLSEHLGRGNEFKSMWELNTNAEISRYQEVLNNGGIVELYSLVDIASMHAFAAYIGNKKQADRLSKLASDAAKSMCRGDAVLEAEVREDYKNMMEFLTRTAKVVEPRKYSSQHPD